MAKSLATKDDLFALVPQLKNLDPALGCQLDAYLTMAGLMISLRTWKGKASQAHALLTAHLLAMVPGNGLKTGAPVKSVTVGPVSKSFAVTACADCELGGTAYGLQYLLLRRTIRRTPLAIGTGLKQF